MVVGIPLIKACAPAGVAPSTISAVIRVESGGDPLALHINGSGGRTAVAHPASFKRAVAIIRKAMAAGKSVDIGLMQVNSRTAAARGYSLFGLLNPCQNIRAGASELARHYHAALRHHVRPGQQALKDALSAYNTGNFHDGFSNGYVARYYGAPRSTGNVVVAAMVSPYTAGMTVYDLRKDGPLSGQSVAPSAPAAPRPHHAHAGTSTPAPAMKGGRASGRDKPHRSQGGVK